MAPTTEACHVWYDLEMLLRGDDWVMERGLPRLDCLLVEGHEGPHVLAQAGLEEDGGWDE
jgi:hypothetical protein